MKKTLLLVALLTLTFGSYAQLELLTNGSFETGALSPWTLSAVNGVDGGPTSCTENWRVQTNSTDVCGFVSDIAPTDGTFAAYTSFDSNALNTEWIIEQDVAIPSTLVAATVSFDFAANFDFTLGAPPTIPRELRVDIYDTGGSPIANVFTDGYIDPVGLSVSFSQSIDVLTLLAGLEGQTVRLRITSFIPEVATGPSKGMIDNVSFIVDDGLSVDEFGLGQALSISPNPSNGTFTLDYQGRENLQSAAIYDITGKRLANFDLTTMTGPSVLNASLPTGMYLLQVVSDKSTATKKLIIK